MGRRDEKAIARRMAEIRDQVADLLQDGWEAWRRRRGPRPPRGRDEAHVASQGEKRTRLYLDREKASQSFFGALSLTTKKMRTYPIQGDQNAEQTRPHDRSSGARDRLGKEDRGHPGQRQAPPHQGPDRPLRLRPGAKAHHTHLYAPPTPPTLGPTKNVRDAARNNIANPRALATQNTFAALTAHITNRTLDYDFEHRSFKEVLHLKLDIVNCSHFVSRHLYKLEDPFNLKSLKKIIHRPRGAFATSSRHYSVEGAKD